MLIAYLPILLPKTDPTSITLLGCSWLRELDVVGYATEEELFAPSPGEGLLVFDEIFY
jgi:hypothetical protein